VVYNLDGGTGQKNQTQIYIAPYRKRIRGAAGAGYIDRIGYVKQCSL